MSTEPRDRTPLLDHGYVQLVETWGSDERIVEAARMSTDKGFLGWVRRVRCTACGHEWEVENRQAVCNFGACSGRNSPTDEVHPGDNRLLRYLWEHKHATPFEFGGLVLEVQAPIFVFREWHRHRTQSYNELSARYTPLPDLSYVPSVERLLQAGGANRQAGGTGTALTPDAADNFREALCDKYDDAEACYQRALSDGISKELARLILPVGRYSRMRASANLRNWLAFLTLRMDPHAQWEIRQYANVVGALVEREFPRTWALFAAGARP